MASPHVHRLPDRRPCDSGALPFQIRRVECQHDIARSDHQAGRKALQPKRGKRQRLVEDRAVPAPGHLLRQDPEELARQAILRQPSRFASGVNHQNPIAAPPRRIEPAQALERRERGAAAPDMAAFRICHDVPGDVAGQVPAFRPIPDLFPVEIGLDLRTRLSGSRRTTNGRRMPLEPLRNAW